MTKTAGKETPPPAGPRRAGGRLRRWLRVARWALYVFLLVAAVLIFTPAGDGIGDWLVHVDPLEGAEYIARTLTRSIGRKPIVSSARPSDSSPTKWPSAWARIGRRWSITYVFWSSRPRFRAWSRGES